MTTEEWEEIVESFQPKTEEQKRKEVEAETRRLQLPLPDMIIRGPNKLLHPQSKDPTNRANLPSV